MKDRFPRLINENRFVIIKAFPYDFSILFWFYEGKIMSSNKTDNSHKHISLINLILSGTWNQIRYFCGTLLLHTTFWLHFKHFTHIEFHCYWNWKVKCFHIRCMITKPVYVNKENLWIWRHSKYFPHCLFVGTTGCTSVLFDAILCCCHWARIVHLP